MISPEVILVIYNIDAPYTGVYHGVDGIMRLYKKIHDNTNIKDIQVVNRVSSNHHKMCIITTNINAEFTNNNDDNNDNAMKPYNFNIVMKVSNNKIVGIAIIENIIKDTININNKNSEALSQYFYKTLYTYGISSENIRELIATDAKFTLQYMNVQPITFYGPKGYEQLYNRLRFLRLRNNLQAIISGNKNSCTVILSTKNTVVTSCMIPSTNGSSF